MDLTTANHGPTPTRHTFEVTKIGDKSHFGADEGHSQHAAIFDGRGRLVADDPGPTFFHCHHQDHMDGGFAGLITYV